MEQSFPECKVGLCRVISYFLLDPLPECARNSIAELSFVNAKQCCHLLQGGCVHACRPERVALVREV